MAQLYGNENFPLPVVEELRRLGHDVLTIQETGKAGQSVLDEIVLKFAAERERAVLTINRKHFIHLHQAQPHHAGIIVCTSTLILRDMPTESTQLLGNNSTFPVNLFVLTALSVARSLK